MARSKSSSTFFDNLDSNFNEYLVKKAPALPKPWKEVIVKVSPWATLIVMILAVPLVLAVLGLGVFVAPMAFTEGPLGGFGYIISMILLAIAIVLEAMAVPGLFKRSAKAWKLIYYSTLVSAVSSLVKFDLGGAIIGPLIGLYILYQIREYYK